MRLRERTGLALLAGMTAMPGVAHADAAADLKAELAALDRRLARLEAAPALPAGHRLLWLGEGAIIETPGAPLDARARAAYAGRARFLAAVPAAGAPQGASISWSGYTRAGVVYNGASSELTAKAYTLQDGTWQRDPDRDIASPSDGATTEVKLRGQLMVQAATETRLGKVGVELQLRVDAHGNDPSTFYQRVAWGYWAMTPALTLGGGYNKSLGDILYGYDGSCTCYFTDNAQVDFDPGDTTQLRATYAAGPFSVAASVESAALFNQQDSPDIPGSPAQPSAGLLGVAGEIAYQGKAFSGEIAGVWRGSNQQETGASSSWQIGLGGSLSLGALGAFTFAAATGAGPDEDVDSGNITTLTPYDNAWWGVNTLASINLGHRTHVELAGGYKHRQGEQPNYKDYDVSNIDYHTYAAMGGLYYKPVDQLTLGLEGEWYATASTGKASSSDTLRYSLDATSQTLTADVVAVWSF